MQCEQVTTLLPWLLNGTLEPEESELVSKHLGECDECRAELRETVLVWTETDTHPSSQTVTDYAFGLSVDPLPRDLLESHLADCEPCRAEIERIQETLTPTTTATPATRATTVVDARAARLRPFLVAAALLVLLAVPFLWRSIQTAAPTPQANLAVLELLPTDERTRGTETSERTARAASIAILLATTESLPADAEYRAIFRDAEQRELWVVDDLRLTRSNDFSVLVPADQLGAGAIFIELESNQESGWLTLATYRFEIEEAADGGQ